MPFSNSDSSNPQALIKELSRPKWLCQYICQLLFSADMSHIHLPIFDAFSDEVKSCVYMLASFMKDGIFAESNSRLGVHLQKKWLALLIFQL